MQSTAELQFETADALAAVGFSRTSWNNLMARKLYEGAPAEPRTGRPRLFSVDDALALYTLAHYSPIVGAAMAARIATAVKAELDRAAAAGKDCPMLWVVFTSEGTPHRVVARPQSGVFTQTIDVAKARDVILTYAEEKLGWTRPA